MWLWRFAGNKWIVFKHVMPLHMPYIQNPYKCISLNLKSVIIISMAYRIFSFKTIFFIFLLFCDDIFKLTNWDIQYGFFVQIHITIGILNTFFVIVVIFDVIFFRSWWCIGCWCCGALCSWLIFWFCVLINVGKALLWSIVIYLKYRVICKEKKWSFFFISTNWHLKDSISNFYTFINASQCYATNTKCFKQRLNK